MAHDLHFFLNGRRPNYFFFIFFFEMGKGPQKIIQPKIIKIEKMFLMKDDLQTMVQP
jgi:hypothetical protein